MELKTLEKTTELGKKGSYKIWMDTGYGIFCKEGPSGIVVERLARELNKNKSGFYHFFGDREYFFETMMKEHLERADEIADRIRRIGTFDPDFYQIMMDYKNPVLFQMQLVKNRETELFAKTFQQFNSKIVGAVIPVWSDHLQVPCDVAISLWTIARDSFYARITEENFNSRFFDDLVKEVSTLVNRQFSN
ncbi:TetR/AcrR family transcriptional regulator [Algoriphagus lacus]|uniref:TetR/AcrR family transcriptional regulator n=1 Tax=Algoriphagus lacus TaxID=2056311 RepID=A0A418PQZ1_9BACT|nr:TetR/AcrR family transcriptional regulator [Algoriphagus lacus]